jgi:hypothetical protein
MRTTCYILILSVFALFSGCDDAAFLEEHPRDTFTPENAFATGKEVDEQLITVYRALASTYINKWWLGNGSDLYDGDDGVTYLGTDSRAESNYGLWTENKFTDQWNTLYQMAAYANLALRGARIARWNSEEEKNFSIAQARFFRGWAYLRLGELFGGVPVVDKFTEEFKLDYTRTTRDSTYLFAIDDFIAALEGLTDPPKQSGRVSRSTVNHFLAEAYLAKGIVTGNKEGEYQKAIAAATDVIAHHPLMTERFGARADPGDTGASNGVPNYRPDGDVFYDLFRKGNYDAPENTESVWVAKSPDLETYLENHSFYPRAILYTITGAAPRFNNMYWAPEYREEGAGYGPWGPINWSISPVCWNSYRGGFSLGLFEPTKYMVYKVWGGNVEAELWDDTRNSELNYSRVHLCIDQDHSLYGQPVTEEMILCWSGRLTGEGRLFPMSAKVFNREDLWGFEPATTYMGIATIYGRDRYLVRSAETYLLRAEAYLRNGQVDKATEDINALRERAECAKLFTEGEVDIYTILDERARELSYEEQRWATLLRIGGEVMKNQLYNNAKYVADRPVFTGTIDWELLPIPRKTVININTGAEIQQNPGWESGK